MRMYGYQKECEQLEELKEVAFECNIEELENIINFLIVVKAEHERVAGKTELCHSHYRDWDKKWTPNSPDFIIVTK